MHLQCIMRKILLVCLLLIGCVSNKPTVRDTRLDDSKRDWVKVYENEIEAAIRNEDVAAYHFFFRELLVEKVRIYRLKQKNKH